jgi:haloalkane dehalogenase
MYFLPFKKRSARRPTNIFPRELLAARQFLEELENGLTAISNKPALILWGDSDFAFKARERNRFQATFPNHKSLDLIGAGHFVQEDAPDAIGEAIASWYAEEETGPQLPDAMA